MIEDPKKRQEEMERDEEGKKGGEAEAEDVDFESDMTDIGETEDTEE